MAWQPLLDGDLAARAEGVVRDIAKDLAERPAEGATLASGASGLALFHAYMEQAGYGGGELADKLLGQAVEAVAEQPLGSSLYSGFTGIAWAADHMTGSGSNAPDGGADEEDPNEEIDSALAEHLEQTPWLLDYDLIIGLVGYGVYALERVGRPGGRRCLELVIDRLADSAVEVPGSPGVTWLTGPHLMIPPTRAQNPDGYYNTGLAHGVPGVTAMLALAIEAGVAVDKARPLLERAMAWLLSTRGEGPDRAQFPYTIDIPAKPGRHPVRAAWCYGDPGVAAALHITGRSAGRPDWEEIALDVARIVVARPPERCGVIDPGLCHGAVGLAHIYNRFYQASGETVFADAARMWTERLLEMRKPGIGIGGFQAMSPVGDTGKLDWATEAGVLTGSAGVGLALIGLLTSFEPKWDRMLLTDLKPR